MSVDPQQLSHRGWYSHAPQPNAAHGQEASVERACWEHWPTKNTQQHLGRAWSPGEGAQDAACTGGSDQDQRVDAQSFGKTEGVAGMGLGDRREG